MAVALVGQAEAALQTGNLGEAERLYERSVLLYRHLGDQGGLAAALDGLGCAHRVLERYLPARDTLAAGAAHRDGHAVRAGTAQRADQRC